MYIVSLETTAGKAPERKRTWKSAWQLENIARYTGTTPEYSTIVTFGTDYNMRPTYFMFFTVVIICLPSFAFLH
ncbi:hypothetical protein Y032_0170g254 [Ancylostoma ceylanicum]|uniref:Uncharacterized protein n=1 Tax=Ancylostoma ceylanicum TaxID=53326 RepID=A0A016SVY7_9BILA|nr:hypothetical protein Y032_0170g254 [Ancylostoma ceylanicum]